MPWRLSSACVLVTVRDSGLGAGPQGLQSGAGPAVPGREERVPALPPICGLSQRCQASPARFLLWLKPISHPDFAAELEKGLVLTWFSFSKFNFLPCFVTPETEALLFIFLGNESQPLL